MDRRNTGLADGAATRALVAVVLWIVVAAPASAAPAGDGVTALVGAVVLDGLGGDPIDDAVVLVQGERIVAVGPRAGVVVPDGAEVVDLTGRWITPGLVDPHIHFFQSGSLYTRPDVIDLRGQRSYEWEAAGIQARLDDTFRRYLASGVTAVVDVGGPMWNFDVRQRALDADLAPRVAVAGPLISTVARPQLDLGDPPIVQVSSPAEARKQVQRQLAQDPDLIKIWFILPDSGDVMENIDVVRATIDAAHRGGVRVAVHATQLETARAAVEAGADILVHSIDDAPVDEEFVELLRQRGTLLTSTVVVYEGYAEVLGRAVQLSEIERRLGDPVVIATWDEMVLAGAAADPDAIAARRDRLLERLPMMAANVAALQRGGVLVNAGTDAGNIGTLHGPSVHREFELLVEAGMTPQQVLVAATSRAALVFAAEPEFGSVEPGKLADLLILDADPLADVANLRRIHRVVLGGRMLVPDELMPANPVDVVQRQVEAYAARDLETFLSTYAPDAILVQAATGETVAAGHEQLRETYGVMFDASPELAITILSRAVSGDHVVDHELVTGMRGGPPVRAVAIYEVRQGRIVRVTFLPREKF